MASRQRVPNGRLKEVGDWTEQTSSSGKRYYYNEKTQVSQWKKPPEWLEYEKKLAKRREDRKSSSRINDHKDHSNSVSSSLKRNSPSVSHGLNGDVDDRRKIVPKPSISSNNNTPSSSSKDATKLSSRHIHSSSHHHHHQSSGSLRKDPSSSAHHSINNGIGVHSPSINFSSSALADDAQNAASSNATPNSKGTPSGYDHIRKHKRERNGDDNRLGDLEPSAKKQELDPQNSILLGALQPPPIAPDLVMDEPMDVADSPPPPVYTKPPDTFAPPKMPPVMPFDEATYTNNRFYNPKLCAYRKPISCESATNDIRSNVQKCWKAEKDLLELETSIISVQSLVLTAHCNSELKRTQSNIVNGGMHRGGSI